MSRDQFTRREVNRALLAVVWTVAVPGAALAQPAPRVLFDFAIAGGWYHGLKDVRGEIALDERLLLRAEPGNPFDSNAVAVHRTDGLMLGYIPRAANEPVARLLSSGATVEAQVVGRLAVDVRADIPEDFAYTGFTSGDPRIRLTLRG